MKDKKSKPLRSIVTGGSGILGQSVIAALHKRGDRVLCLDKTPPETGDTEYVPLDVVDRTSVNKAMSEVQSKLGGLDVLVHSVGILIPAAFLEISDEDMAKHLEVNLMGAFRVAQSAARMMKKEGGRIVLITSIHGQVGVPERGAYAASKGGIASFARVMAAELAQYRIRVNVLAPGAVDGGMMPNPNTRTGWVAATPIQRVAHLEEVATVAQMLTSDSSSFINGQIIAVDGGASTLKIFPNVD